MTMNPAGLPPAGLRAVIFDLDGTLVDSAGEIAAALNAVLAELHRPPLSRAEVEALIGRGVRALVERGLRLARVADARVDHAVERFSAHYASLLGTQSRLYPGVREGLATLESAGMPMAVVTNKPRAFSEQLLDGLGIASFFRVIVAGDDGIPCKPAGDMLVAAARSLGADVDSALMLGDSENDVRAARDAGCMVWCVPYGYNEGRGPETLQADGLVRDIGEAARLLVAREDGGDRAAS